MRNSSNLNKNFLKKVKSPPQFSSNLLKFEILKAVGTLQLLRNTMSTNWFFDNFEKDHHHFHLVHNGTNWFSGPISIHHP